MRTNRIRLVVICILGSFFFGLRAEAEQKVRIGVYDSRAVAVAYGASEMRKTNKTPTDQAIAEAEKERAKAKEAGDDKRVNQLRAKLLEMRQQGARAAFGAAPVDDILDLIKDRLPKLQRQAKVTKLVSKWDSDTLFKYQSAELVDVTLLLVAEFSPKPRTLRSIWGVQQAKPISRKTTDKAVKEGI